MLSSCVTHRTLGPHWATKSGMEPRIKKQRHIQDRFAVPFSTEEEPIEFEMRSTNPRAPFKNRDAKNRIGVFPHHAANKVRIAKAAFPSTIESSTNTQAFQQFFISQQRTCRPSRYDPITPPFIRRHERLKSDESVMGSANQRGPLECNGLVRPSWALVYGVQVPCAR